MDFLHKRREKTLFYTLRLIINKKGGRILPPFFAKPSVKLDEFDVVCQYVHGIQYRVIEQPVYFAHCKLTYSHLLILL